MRRITRTIRAFTPYVANVALSAVASIAVIPVLTRSTDGHTWAVYAIGQSIGAAGAVLVGVSWPVTGAARVAGATVGDKSRLFRRSLATRLPILGLAVLAVCVAVVVRGAASDELVWSLAATALLCSGMSNAWFFVGERSPLRLLLLETAPRAAGTLLGLGLLLSGASTPAFLVVQLVGWALPVLLSSLDVARRTRVRGTESVSSVQPGWRREALGASSSIIATAYVQVPTLFVAAIAPGSVGAFAVVDKIQKFSLTAISPVTQFAQGHVPHGETDALNRRVRRAAAAAVVLGAMGAVLFTVLGPFVAAVLAGGVIEIDVTWTLPFGIAFGAIAASGIVGLACLPALARDADLLRSIVIGAVVGVPLCWVGAVVGGGRGAAWAVAAAECVVLAWQLRTVVRTTSHRSAVGPVPSAPNAVAR